MKLTSIYLPFVAIASLMIVSTGCAKDSFKDQVFNKHVRNDVAKGLAFGTIGGTVGSWYHHQPKTTAEEANQAGVGASLLLVGSSQAYNYKNNELSWKSGLTQTISTVAGYLISVKGIEFLLSLLPAGSQKPNL